MILAARKLHPERLCDLLGPGLVAGERFDGLPHMAILIRTDAPPRTDAELFAGIYRGLWYDAHYGGVPTREREHDLARWRRAIHRVIT